MLTLSTKKADHDQHTLSLADRARTLDRLFSSLSPEQRIALNPDLYQHVERAHEALSDAFKAIAVIHLGTTLNN